MAESSASIQEITHYLESVLSAKENLQNISVNLTGNSEKGDGFLGDIVFVEATGTHSQTNSEKTINLVLKLSRKDQAFRDLLHIKQVFDNEIFLYEVVVSDFTKFQLEKNIPNEKVFDNVPKFYGKYTNESIEVIVFENLKKLGFDLWNKALPLTSKHLEKVMKAYAKFHALSVAMQDQQPKRFEKLSIQFEGDLYRTVIKKTGIDQNYLKKIKDAIIDLQGYLSDEVLQKFSKFPAQVPYIFSDMRDVKDCVKVLTHADCWNNNFMWKHNENDAVLPEKVAIIDWQCCGFLSPIFDLSYFLFACISPEDAKNVDRFLDVYYKSFSEFLRDLGSDPEKLYRKEEFLSDWKKYGRFGVVMSIVACQIAGTEKSGLPDNFATITAEGKSINESFVFKNFDKDLFRKRFGAVVQYSANHGLFD